MMLRIAASCFSIAEVFLELFSDFLPVKLVFLILNYDILYLLFVFSVLL